MLVALLATSISSAEAKDTQGRARWSAPTGSYAVGRTHFNWTDPARHDARDSSRQREIVVWVWYPATVARDAEPAQWLPGDWQKYAAANLRQQGQGAAQSIESIHTHAHTDAPFVAGVGRFPVLVFAPGMEMLPLQYSNLIEEMVSHGYVVAGIVPTNYSFTVLSGGRVVEAQKYSPPMIPPGLTAQQMKEKMGEEQARSNATAKDWSDDVALTLSQLERLNVEPAGRFKARLDLERVGAFGHSQGGATSLLLAKNDARVRAAFDIDGMLPKEVADGGVLGKPVAVLSSDTLRMPPGPPPGPPPAMSGPAPATGTVNPGPDSFGNKPPPMMMNNLMNYDPALRTAKPGYRLRLAGSTHLFSADLELLQLQLRPADQSSSGPGGPHLVTAVSGQGSIDAARALLITKTYVRAFFDQYLKGTPSALFEQSLPEYPELSFEKLGG